MNKVHYFLEPLPQSLNINGQEVPINTDFRAVLKYDYILQQDTGNGEKLIEALIIMFGDILPDDLNAVLEELTIFIQGGIKEERSHKPSKKILGVNNNKAFDFFVDDRLIWSAFFYTYKIDLRNVKYLHWWDFLELLEELPDNVRISKIMQYRTIDTKSPHIGKEQKAIYEALQRHYKLTEKKSAEDDLINEALRQGKDPAHFIGGK